MKKKDLDTTAAGLAFVNSGTVPVLDVLSDPAAVALVGLNRPDRENEEEETPSEDRRKE